MSETTKKLLPFSGGIVFTGRFTSQKQAEKACAELEQKLVVEYGYTHVRGGITHTERPICGCEGPLECDRRAGCLFNSYAEDATILNDGLDDEA